MTYVQKENTIKYWSPEYKYHGTFDWTVKVNINDDLKLSLVYELIFNEGVLTKDNIIYKGKFENNELSGYGYITYPDKFYIGNVKNSKQNGEGELYDSLGKSIKKCNWLNNEANIYTITNYPDNKIKSKYNIQNNEYFEYDIDAKLTFVGLLINNVKTVGIEFDNNKPKFQKTIYSHWTQPIKFVDPSNPDIIVCKKRDNLFTPQVKLVDTTEQDNIFVMKNDKLYYFGNYTYDPDKKDIIYNGQGILYKNKNYYIQGVFTNGKIKKASLITLNINYNNVTPHILSPDVVYGDVQYINDKIYGKLKMPNYEYEGELNSEFKRNGFGKSVDFITKKEEIGFWNNDLFIIE